MYQALYRKYRPKTFDDVVGQDYVISTLKNSILNNKINHAYMFFGPRGIGKTTIAKIFARAVNCTDTKDGNPCEKCQSCINSSANECVDIIEIDAASNNGVDEIREIKSKVNLVPAELKYKVYIIDEVHMLTSGAFNALLKTLEEPPKHVIFILATTDPQKVSETIVSRCQCFSFKRISDESNVERLKQIAKLENINIDDDTLKEISIFSDGGLRDSLGVLDKLSSYKNDKITVDDFYNINDMISKKTLEDFYNIILSGDVKSMIMKLDSFHSTGKNIVEIMNQFLIYLKDLVVNYYLNGNDINVEITELLLQKINEKMFDIKKASKPYIFVEILFLNFMNSFEKKSKIISREIISGSANALGNNLTVEKEKNVSIVAEVEENVSVDNDSVIDDKSTNSLSKLNYLYDLMKVRVHNTLALASKTEKNNDSKLIDSLNDYVFDQKVGYIVSEILNGTLRASSPESMIISYEYKSVVDQNLDNIDNIQDAYQKITNSDKKIVFITDQEWENAKKEYIEFTKQGNKYKIEDEPIFNESVELGDENKLENEEISNFDAFKDILEIN